MHYTDTELLNFLQSLTDTNQYTGRVIVRNSFSGRGWLMHETKLSQGESDVRQAIQSRMTQLNYVPPNRVDPETIEQQGCTEMPKYCPECGDWLIRYLLKPDETGFMVCGHCGKSYGKN